MQPAGSNFTPGHTLRVMNPQGTAIGDAGGAAGSSLPGQGYLTEMGITNTGTPLCINDALTNAAGGYHAFCLGANSNGGGLISYNAFGGASALPLTFNINGLNVPFPQPAVGASSPYFSVSTFGAKCDGTTQDSGSIQNALNTAGAAGGGVVWVAPTGHACVIQTGLTVPAGVHLMGAGGLYWTSPIDNTESDWTAKSSWFRCQDTVNPCVTITGNAASVEGMNFWYTQPTPSSSACANPCTFATYAYTTYPYTITVANTAGVGVWIKNNNIANASHCLDWEGPSSGISGAYSGISRNSFGCLKKGMLLHLVDDTLIIDGNRFETWWYQGTAQVWWAMESTANGYIAMDVQYLANAQIHNNEFAFIGTAMQFTDASVVSGFGPITFAAAGLQGTGNSFNEVCTAMAVASSTTHVGGEFDNTILFTDSTTSPVSGQCARAQPYAINLASDNANFTFNGIQGGFVQSLAFIGGGGGGSVHGQLHLKNAGVQQFSAYANGANALATDSTGGLIDTSASTPYFYPSGSFTAGTICSGPGCGSSAAFVFGNLEIGGAASATRQLIFSQTVAANPLGNTIGQEVWGWRVDASNNLNLDRSATPGTYTDSPIVVNLSSGNINLNHLTFPGQFTVASLPTCNGGNTGAIAVATDLSVAPTYLATGFTGGGSHRDLVMCNGAAWEAH